MSTNNSKFQRPPLRWIFPGAEWWFDGDPRLMAILNVTPDSFSDGTPNLDPGRAADRGLELINQGADLLDVGGESTRPGASPVSEEEEIRRVIPVIERVARQSKIPISVDTTKAVVAERALDAGAVIVNDISGLLFDPSVARVCAKFEAGVVCMHMQGTPRTMQQNPQYVRVVDEIAAYLGDRIGALEQAGIGRERIVVDPGIGFGKTAEHNLEILRNVARFRALGRPVLVGHSRKAFLGKLLGRPVDERLAGTLGTAVALSLAGVDILRVHDVGPVRDALAACRAILSAADFAGARKN